MGILTGLFHSRDKPKNSLGSAFSFLFGGTTSGKTVNEYTALQTTAVYACVRILAETIAGLPLHVYRYRIRTVDSGSEAVSPEVVRTFTVLASPFEDVVANVTKVKAAHMRSLRTAINNVRDFYGMPMVSWSEDIASGKTYAKNWPFHVLELRKAIEQVVDAINTFDVAWANKLPDPAWIPITTVRPQAAVMQQLQTLILGL